VPPFLCTYMGRRTKSSRGPLRFIWNRSSAIGANVYLLLTPLPWLQRQLDENPEAFEVVWNSLTEIEEEQFVTAGRTYGGGLRKIEPRELGSLAIGGGLAEMKTG